MDVDHVQAAVGPDGEVARPEPRIGGREKFPIALAGRAVHVITVNDYLAERDAQWMRPVYEALGLSVGCIRQGMEPDARRAAYRCDIAYCSNKEIAFDYLRDRMVLGGKSRPIASRIDALAGAAIGDRLLLRGLQFAIVDEADSVLVDEARTPLILSAHGRHSQQEELHRKALELARQLPEGDYRIGVEGVEIAEAGLEKLEALSESLSGVWRGPRRREQLVRQALSALHVFRRDKHYLVRDGKVVIIDENTGRLMPDRSWEQGLHQLIELKEGCEVTGQRETLARISYQRFFRRYVHLAGMTGTAREVAGELWAVYRLRVASIPTQRPGRRARVPGRVYGRSELKWRAVVATVSALRAAGRPVLIGTRSVAASDALAAFLELLHHFLKFHGLLGRQDFANALVRLGPDSIELRPVLLPEFANRGAGILHNGADLCDLRFIEVQPARHLAQNPFAARCPSRGAHQAGPEKKGCGSARQYSEQESCGEIDVNAPGVHRAPPFPESGMTLNSSASSTPPASRISALSTESPPRKRSADSLSVALLATVIGLTIGLISGFVEWLDGIVMRVMDGVMAIPPVLLAIAMMALTGPSIKNVVLAITVPEVVTLSVVAGLLSEPSWRFQKARNDPPPSCMSVSSPGFQTMRSLSASPKT